MPITRYIFLQFHSCLLSLAYLSTSKELLVDIDSSPYASLSDILQKPGPLPDRAWKDAQASMVSASKTFPGDVFISTLAKR